MFTLLVLEITSMTKVKGVKSRAVESDMTMGFLFPFNDDNSFKFVLKLVGNFGSDM